jgi:hypothetical protein
LRIAELSAMGVTVTTMRLEMMTAGDVELRLRTETDPVMMAELGMAAEGRCWPLR